MDGVTWLHTVFWTDIPGWEGRYRVSTHGQVMALAKNVNGRQYPDAILAQFPSGGGGRYRSVQLCADGTRTVRTVHGLMAEAFIGPRPPGHHVRHYDDIGTNNVITNILYGTPAENGADKRRNRALRAQQGRAA